MWHSKRAIFEAYRQSRDHLAEEIYEDLAATMREHIARKRKVGGYGVKLKQRQEKLRGGSEKRRGRQPPHDGVFKQKKGKDNKTAPENSSDAVIRKTQKFHEGLEEEEPFHSHKCNSEKLRDIMKEKMVGSPSASKQMLYSAVRAVFGRSPDVICSRHSFSYIVVSSPMYCEHRKPPSTCFVYFQP